MIGHTATLFAALMSVFNAGGAVSSAGGAALTSAFGVTSTEFTHLAPLVLVCNVLALVPLCGLRLLDAADFNDRGGGGMMMKRTSESTAEEGRLGAAEERKEL